MSCAIELALHKNQLKESRPQYRFNIRDNRRYLPRRIFLRGGVLYIHTFLNLLLKKGVIDFYPLKLACILNLVLNVSFSIFWSLKFSTELHSPLKFKVSSIFWRKINFLDRKYRLHMDFSSKKLIGHPILDESVIQFKFWELKRNKWNIMEQAENTVKFRGVKGPLPRK